MQNTPSLFVAGSLWVGVALPVAFAGLEPANLRCEYLRNPSAVEASPPRLSWELMSDRRADRQTAWQIRVGSSPAVLDADRGDVWDSGRVLSGESLHIEYGGRQLRSRESVWWTVRVWDADGQVSRWSEVATWRMGLLAADDWQGQWISHGVELAPGQPARNGFHSRLVDQPRGRHSLALHLASPCRVEEVVLFPARPFNWAPDSPGFLFPKRFRLSATNVDVEYSLADYSAAEFPNPGTNAVRIPGRGELATDVVLQVNELARRDEAGYAFALAEIEVWSGGTNVARRARVTASSSIEEGGWSTNHLADGDPVSHGATPADAQPATWLRREFAVSARPARATLYATALGLYEAHLNGLRIGDQVLAPEWTDYHRRVQYQAYDVTEIVRVGSNCLAAVLGDGWYAGRLGMSDGLIGVLRGVYGPKPWFLAQLELEMPGGERILVATDESWRVTREGPIRSSDLLDGEGYDARRELLGWDHPGFEFSGWASATVRPRELTPRLVAQPNEPIRVIEELKPLARWEPRSGVAVFDFGQNLVGRCRVWLNGPAGTLVTLRHAEMTNADGSIYVANLRGAPQVDRYTLRGARPETYEPRFTQHGFRFLEVSGVDRLPSTLEVLARAFNSSAREVGEFECSEPMLTQLWRNIRWTQRANLMSVPTDCPQRDERLGWMGDIQAFCQTAIYQMDMAAFFTKWVVDIRDGQAADGRFPDFAPHPYGPDQRFSGAPAWADAGVIVPWRCYQNYGDRRMLEQHYDAARRWVDYVGAKNPRGLWRQARGNDYSDWLNGDTLRREGWPLKGGAVPQEVLATAFHAYTLRLVSEMAGVLGRREEQRRYGAWAEATERAFNDRLVDGQVRVQGDTQAGYALALELGLLSERRISGAVTNLVRTIDRYEGRLSTGIQSTHRMLLALSRHGRGDVAWRLVTNRVFPSWGYMIDNGATTIWERWDGFVAGRGFQDAGMNSFNHWAFGSIGEWLMRHAAGIAPDDQAPGWRQAVLAPQPGGGVYWARARYHSIRGPIVSEWRRGNAEFRLVVDVPANVTATVYFPGLRSADVREGELELKEVPGVLQTGDTPAAWVKVGSGRYDFRATP